ncbi:hypothetical protein G7Y89_g1422 [Cudoniella acicularis]|uniref:Uncharacterized protein n=1 Tax=Cudoniella acicularis TaxID=354080 RepID=A0A8H4W7F2_9HELO|nr:hypothetical protein G7Y89_g1422 [Cudoniella acicularis]
MPSLLDLPREIRDKILSLVISIPTTPPRDHSVADSRTELYNPSCGGRYVDRGVKYPTRMNRTETIPTLLVNRQLHDETLSAIDLLPTKHTYILDILLVGGSSLWPTWISVPALTNLVDTVSAAVRIDHTGKITYRTFEAGDGSPPSITWTFYRILDRFLRVGPVVNPSAKPEGGIAVKTLELDIRTPDVPESRFIPHDKWRIRRGNIFGKDKNGENINVMPPSMLLPFIERYIELLMGMRDMRDYTTCHGGILYERIGTLKLLLDGELRREWDMAKELKNIRLNDSFSVIPREERPETFRKWKANAYKLRTELGLPTIPISDDTKGTA